MMTEQEIKFMIFIVRVCLILRYHLINSDHYYPCIRNKDHKGIELIYEAFFREYIRLTLAL